MRSLATRRMRELVGWTMLSVVVTASRLAIWIDDVMVPDHSADHEARDR